MTSSKVPIWERVSEFDFVFIVITIILYSDGRTDYQCISLLTPSDVMFRCKAFNNITGRVDVISNRYGV